jgi:hypothetical protein
LSLHYVQHGSSCGTSRAPPSTYARSGYTILPKLPDALASRTKEIPTLVAPQPCGRSKAGSANEVVHISQHERTFNYVENGKAAPAITIRHLWLKRD